MRLSWEKHADSPRKGKFREAEAWCEPLEGPLAWPLHGSRAETLEGTCGSPQSSG